MIVTELLYTNMQNRQFAYPYPYTLYIIYSNMKKGVQGHIKYLSVERGLRLVPRSLV